MKAPAHTYPVRMLESFQDYAAGKIYLLGAEGAGFLTKIGVGIRLFMDELTALIPTEQRKCECGSQVSVYWASDEAIATLTDVPIAKEYRRNQLLAKASGERVIDADEHSEVMCSCGRRIDTARGGNDSGHDD